MTRYVYEIQAGTRHRKKYRAEHYHRRDTFRVCGQNRGEARASALEVLDGMDLELRGRMRIKRLREAEGAQK